MDLGWAESLCPDPPNFWPGPQEARPVQGYNRYVCVTASWYCSQIACCRNTIVETRVCVSIGVESVDPLLKGGLVV